MAAAPAGDSVKQRGGSIKTWRGSKNVARNRRMRRNGVWHLA